MFRFQPAVVFKKSLILVLGILPCLLWSQPADEIRISGKFVHVPFLSVISSLESDYPIKFYFKEDWFVHDTLDVTFENNTFAEIPGMLLRGRPFTYRIIKGQQAVFLPMEAVAVLIGKMLNYSDIESNTTPFIQIGNAENTGKSKQVDLTGQIRDGKTGEPVIGAVVQVNNLQLGAVTDLEGNYKLTLAPGLYTLIATSVGFEKNQYYVKLLSEGTLNMDLFDKSIALEDIIIYGQRVDKNISSHQMSLVELDAKSIKQLPSVAGGKDVLKGLTTMPGIKSIGEFSSGINVRGGGEDQNLYLVNGAPLFNTSHVFGLISVINPDAVEKLSLYKGHIPALYGERVSSVIDIRTHETAPAKTKIKGGIGLYDSKLLAEVPLYRDKVYFAIGGRTSYSNWILKSIRDNDLRNSLASFYDLNGTLQIVLPKSRLSLSGYTCYDAFRFASEVKYGYGSSLGSVNWNYMVNPNLGSYLTLSYSHYEVAKDDISSELMQSRTRSGIEYTGLKYRLKYSGIKHHNIDAGLNLVSYLVNPGNLTPLNLESLVLARSLATEKGNELAIFINDEYNINEYLIFNAGLRISGYKTDNSDFIFGIEPRISSRIKFGDYSSVKLSYNRNIQYLSLISLSSVSTPGDFWKLSNSHIKPITVSQYAVGYYRNYLNNSIETSVEVYYKGMKNLVEYTDGTELEMNETIDGDLLNAEGVNYGIEFSARKNGGRMDGWIGYTYSRSFRKTSGAIPSEQINNNRYFPSPYDRPHDFTVIANFHITKRMQFSANFNYASGRPVTLPEYKYFAGSEVAVVFSDRNAYRIPAYHRLDISISLDESLKIKKKWKGSWSLSLLNVYGRKNAYTIYYKEEIPDASNNFNRFGLYKLYLIGRPLPTLTYSFMF